MIISNGDHHIKDYVEKPTSSYLVSMGVYVFEPHVMDYIGVRSYLDFPDLVKELLGKGETMSYFPFNGYWLDIGRHDDYAQAAQEFENLNQRLGLLQKID